MSRVIPIVRTGHDAFHGDAVIAKLRFRNNALAPGTPCDVIVKYGFNVGQSGRIRWIQLVFGRVGKWRSIAGATLRTTAPDVGASKTVSIKTAVAARVSPRWGWRTTRNNYGVFGAVAKPRDVRLAYSIRFPNRPIATNRDDFRERFRYREFYGSLICWPEWIRLRILDRDNQEHAFAESSTPAMVEPAITTTDDTGILGRPVTVEDVWYESDPERPPDEPPPDEPPPDEPPDEPPPDEEKLEWLPILVGGSLVVVGSYIGIRS